MNQRERNLCRIKSLICEISKYNRVLSAGEKDTRTLELGSYLSEDVYRLCLEFLKMRNVIAHFYIFNFTIFQ